jgi:hypothetical protein
MSNLENNTKKEHHSKIFFITIPLAIAGVLGILVGIIYLVRAAISYQPINILSTNEMATNNKTTAMAVTLKVLQLSETPTATIPSSTTQSPTNTYTLTPIPSITPENIYEAAGFSPTTPLYTVGTKIGDILEVQNSSSYVTNSGNEFIHAISFKIPGFIESIAFNRELDNPEYIPQIIVNSLGGQGISDLTDLPGKKIGERSRGITFTTQLNNTTIRLEVVMFRTDSEGAVVVLGYPDDQTAPIDVFFVAQELVDKINNP